jgi:putative chitinase
MLTKVQIKTLFPRASTAHGDSFFALHGALFTQFGIGQNLFRLHFFLAQIGHESGGLSIERENMNYSAKRMTEVWPSRFPTEAAAAPYAHNPEKLGNFVYGGRMDNGPPASGDGFRYRGRGYVQLTGKEAYLDVGNACGLGLVADPDLVYTPANALRVALGFWKWKDANAVCDTGDFKAVTRKVNGGLTGFPDRLAWLDKVRRTVLTIPTRKVQPVAAVIILVQKALRNEGYTAVGAADGIIGARTMAALTDYRVKHGLGDGLIDGLLLDSLGVIYP